MVSSKGVHYVPVVTLSRSAFGAVAVCLAGVLAAACSSGHTTESRRIVVTASGRIGPLHVDESDKADVTSLLGRPDSERRGRYADQPPFDALGYGCKGHPATDKDGVPNCATVFYLDARSGKLALLYTGDDRFAEVHGVHTGTPTAVAERLLHQRPFVGCFDGLRFETKTGFLVLWFDGGKDVESGGRLHLAGGRVGFLVVHSQHLNPGVLDCIDS
jgi:hypothetical protein